MNLHYQDDDEYDVQVLHRAPSPQPVRYVQTPTRPHSYTGPDAPVNASWLVPDHRGGLVARSPSRERSRSRGPSCGPSRDHSRDPSRDRRPSPGPPAIAQLPPPVIINNRIYNDQSSDDEDHRQLQVARPSRSRSHSRSRSSSSFMTREEWEAERAREELEKLRITSARDKDEKRRAKEYREEAELQHAKRQLDDIKKREAKTAEERRIIKELELKRLKEEEEAAEESRRREKEAADAVERYKQREMERLARERKVREENEREYQRRLRDDLVKSGLDDKAIAAILNKEKIQKAAAPAPPAPLRNLSQPPPQAMVPAPAPLPSPAPAPGARPTYTRMARRHLSIETLQAYRVEYDLDQASTTPLPEQQNTRADTSRQDPEYVLIKRWVPEWEQDQLWKHTKYVREKRSGMLMVEEKRSSRHETEFEWVRKKSHDRKRSKSPGLLTYLAGGRPT